MGIEDDQSDANEDEEVIKIQPISNKEQSISTQKNHLQIMTAF